MVTPPPELPPIEDPPRAAAPSARLLWTIRVLAVCAAAVAGYLAVTSILLKDLPIGCGSGSGCGEVLQSDWSAVFGVPVGFFGAGAYLAVLLATFFDRKGAVLLGLSVAIAASAVWFIVLQAFVLDAYCIWCMTDHALGLAMAVAAFAYVDGLAGDDPSGPTRATQWAVLGGIALAASLVVILKLWGAPTASIARLPENGNADTGPGPDRRIAVLSGKLELDVHDVPVLGSPDADALVVILYDYCCPHCRRTHEFLVEGLERYGEQMGLILLPMPLDEDCNSAVLPGETDERFEESCDLARLALAVWRADPSAFAEYDAWLYAPETPRTAAAARAEAEKLISPEALDAALADDWIDNRIAADVKAYLEGGTLAIPVVLSPGMDAIVGRAESAEELYQLLETELGLTAATE